MKVLMRFGAIVMMACILPLLGISNLHSATVTVKLIDHNGSLITTGGATLSYHDGSWTNLGTSATGEWSVTSAAGSVTYKMTYNNGSQQIVEPISTDPVIFQTVAVTPALKNSGGTALGGGTVKFHQITWKNWAGAANTADELLPGKYTFKMTYNNGSQQIVETVGGTTHEVLFTTVTVTPSLKDSDGAALAGGTVKFHQITWQNWTGLANTANELLPGKYTFRMTYNNGSQQIVQTVAGTDDEVPFVTVSVTPALKDSDGNLVAGGTVQYHQITWMNWAGAANTVDELLPGKYTFKMTVNNGSQQIVKTVSGTDYEVLFETVTVTPSLKDCDDNALAGGTVQYHQITWANWTNANTPKELLPGKYTFKMTYNNGRQQVVKTVGGNSYEVPFVTTTVDFGYAGLVKYHQIGWQNFTGPQELLPGKYTFKFDNYSQQYDISGCSFEKTAVIFKLLYANGSGAAGAKGYIHHGGWQMAPGTTGSNGILIALFDGVFSGNKKFYMSYESGPGVFIDSKHTYYNISSNPVVEFHLSRVTARLWDGSMSLPTAEGGDLGKLYVHNGGWKYLGMTTNGEYTFDIFAGNRKFRMKDVNYSSRDKYYNVPTGYYNMDWPVVREIVQAKDQSGSLVTDTDFEAWIHYGGWKSLGKDSDDGQDGIIHKGVLAGNHKFRMELSYSSYDKYFNSTIALFKAVRNAVHVKDQCGSYLGIGDYSAKAWVHYGGWKYLGEDSDDGMDGIVPCVLLEGNRKFRMELGPSSYDKYFHIKQTPVYAMFDAVRNPVEVRDQDGNLLPDTEYPVSGKVWVHYGGWKPLPDLSGGVCNTVLLRGNRKFRMEINYSSYDKYFHIKPTGVCTADLAVFEALKDPVNLVDCNNNGIAGGDAWVHYGGWKSLGTTNAAGTIPNMSLLSGNRKFRMKHSGISQDKYIHIKWGAPPTLATFLASTLTLQFSGTIKYNYGGWQTYTGPMVFLAGSYNFTFDGMPKTLDLSGACNQTKSVVIFTLLKGTGAPAPGGKGYINNGGWKLSPGVTDANGKLIALFDGLIGGTRSLQMNYDDGLGVWIKSKIQNQNIALNSYLTFNLTTTHFQAWDGSAIVTQADGGDPDADIRINSGGWKQLGKLGSDGELVVEMFAGTHSFNCNDYNYSSRTLNHNTGADNYVRFGTRKMAIELRDENNVLVPDAKGIGDAYINSGGWKSLGSTSGGVVDVALLHGTWSLNMKMNHTSQTKNVNITGGPAVFTALNNAVEVRDENFALVPDAKGIGAAYINDGGWKFLGNTSGGVVDITLLTGTHSLNVKMNHTSQTKNVNIAAGAAVFNARNNTIEIRDENNALVPDAKVMGDAKAYINDGGWKHLGNASNGVVDITLLTGTHSLNVDMNYTSQTKNVNISGGPAVFNAMNNAMQMKDENGNLVQDADGIATGYINNGGWKLLGNTSNGIVDITLLTGTHSLNMRMNYTSQTKNVNISGGPAIFDALVKSIRLEDGSGTGIAGGDAFINSGGWKSLGTTDATGWVPNLALLAGSNSYRMDYDPGGGTVTKVKNVNLKHVPLTQAIFVWDGVNLNKDRGEYVSAPESFALEQNYPNPFNPTTTIAYSVPSDAQVTIVIYDMLGNDVATLVDGMMPAGTHTAVWDGTNSDGEVVATGKYLYKMISGQTTITKTMTFMK